MTLRLFGILAASLVALAATAGLATAASDATPPSVSITHPGPGGHAWGTTVVGADAQDAGGVARVEFRVDGTLAGTDSSGPFELRWDTRGLAPGSTHVLSARAFDTSGNATS